ncbi:hypothetical protein BC830DRAFT_1141042 [Chytriomyces sp. MP71]|nr:hypothetical protein BC830DRAFT_1141042 [Chytriomyces sp. MP71]
MCTQNRLAAVLHFFLLITSVAYADPISDGAEAFSHLPPCFQSCYSVATPLNATGLNYVCSSLLPGFDESIVACIVKCAIPTDNTFLQNMTNIGTRLGAACQSLVSTTNGANILLTQEVSRFPPCFQACISNASIPSPQAFCAAVANLTQTPLTDCVRGGCNETVQEQFTNFLGNATGNRVLRRVCESASGATSGPNATGTLQFGGAASTGTAGSTGAAKGESNGDLAPAMSGVLAVVFAVVSFFL